MTVTVAMDGHGVIARTRRGRCRVLGASARIGEPAAAAVWPSGHRDQLVVVEAITEAPLMELRGAVVERPRWVLNGIGSMSFTISTHDPALLECLVDPATVVGGTGELKLLGREVQWWRDGELRWAGVPVAADVQLDGRMRVECQDLGWYLHRRFMGSAERRDLLSGVGQMDRAGLPGWARVSSAVAVRNTTVKRRGVGSAQVLGVGALTATFRHPPMSIGQDLTVMATAEVRVPDTRAVGDRLISITAVPVGSSDVYRPGDHNNAEVQVDTPLGGWSRHTAVAYMRPGVAHDVTVTLWSLGGASPIYFDDVRALKNDTTGIPVPGGDLARHVQAIIAHAQSESRGKSNFGFVIAEPYSFSGTVEVLGIRHMEHTQILDLLRGYTEREDGIDWWIDPRRRRFCIAHRKGTDRTDDVLHERSVMAGGWTHDESERSTAVVVIGEGSGPDRPEGGWIDRVTLDGIVLDHLHRPPNGTPLAALDPSARQIGARLSQPQVRLDQILVPGDWWGDRCEVGDRFPVEFSSGVVRTVALFRVGEVTHDLERNVLELV